MSRRTGDRRNIRASLKKSRMFTTASRAVSGLRRPTRFSQECQRNSMRDVTIRGSSAATDCRMNFKLRPKTKPDRLALAHRRYDVRGVQFHPESVPHARRPENDRKLVENINSTRQTFVKATASAQHLKSSLPDTGKHCGCTKHTQPARHHHQKGIRSIPLTKRIAQTTRNNNDKQAL